MEENDMTNTFPKFLSALGAAAFLFAAPLAAQNAGGGAADVYPSQDMDARVTPYKSQMMDTFRGLGPRPPVEQTFDASVGETLPPGIEWDPVPDEIVEISPETRGYGYVTLPDGRIALVHPEDNTIATIIE
jgi:hypothetical protein